LVRVFYVAKMGDRYATETKHPTAAASNEDSRRYFLNTYHNIKIAMHDHASVEESVASWIASSSAVAPITSALRLSNANE
jgi:hypothetical protein